MKELDEKLSAFIDDEEHDVDSIVKSLTRDNELSAKWQRYHLVKDAIKGQLSEQPTLDISSQVSKALENEAVIFTPKWKRHLTPRFIMKQVAGVAVAATVGTVAILSVQQTQLVDNNSATVAAVNSPVATQVNNISSQQLRQVAFTTREKLDEAVESKLSGYLVNHNEYSKSVNVSGIMPYTRIVSFVPKQDNAKVTK